MHVNAHSGIHDPFVGGVVNNTAQLPDLCFVIEEWMLIANIGIYGPGNKTSTSFPGDQILLWKWKKHRILHFLISFPL